MSLFFDMGGGSVQGEEVSDGSDAFGSGSSEMMCNRFVGVVVSLLTEKQTGRQSVRLITDRGALPSLT